MEPHERGERRDHPLDHAYRRVCAAEVVDDIQVAAGPAHAAHLFQQALGVRRHRHDVHRHDLVEAVVSEGHALGIHAVQLHVIEPAVQLLCVRTLKHVRRDVDADDPNGARVQGQGQARAHTDLEDPFFRKTAHSFHDGTPSRLQHCAKIKVVAGRIAPIDLLNGLQIHEPSLSLAFFEMVPAGCFLRDILYTTA